MASKEKSKTWYCDIIFCHPAFPKLERMCRIRIHDPELLLGTSLRKSGRGTFLEGEDVLSEFEVHEFPAYGFFYSRELHISPLSYSGIKPASYPRMVIREGSRYLAMADISPWNAILYFLWQTGEKELTMQAAETASKEAIEARKQVDGLFRTRLTF